VLGILMAGWFLAGAGSCSRRVPTTGIFIDPAFGTLISPDTKLIAGVRLDKVRETPLYKKLNAQFDLQRQLDFFSQRTGLDPSRSIWQVLMISDGTDPVFLARGKFGNGETEPSMGALGSERTSYKTYTLLGSAETSLVFINPSVAAAGSRAALKRLIDHRAEYKGIPASLEEKLKNMPHADQLFLVAEGNALPVNLSGPDTTGAKSMLSNLIGYIQATAIGVQIDQGAELKAAVDCISAEGAQRVRDTVKGAVGLARLNTREDQMQMLKLYDSVGVTGKDSHVDIAAQVAPDLVDPLLQMLGTARGRSAGIRPE
jgi:hypothetical protein